MRAWNTHCTRLLALAVTVGVLGVRHDAPAACNSPAGVTYYLGLADTTQKYYCADEAAAISVTVTGDSTGTQPVYLGWNFNDGTVVGSAGVNFGVPYTITLPASVMTPSSVVDEEKLTIVARNIPDDYTPPDGNVCIASVTKRFTVLKVELKSIEFTSDHEDGGGANLLQDYNADYAGTGAAYSEPEWVNGGDNHPVSHTKDTKITAKVKIKVEPAGITFDLKGAGPDGYVDFNKAVVTSTGADQEVAVTADANLPNEVDTMTKSIDWTIKVGTLECVAGTSGGHKIYVTYGTPTGGGYTEKRINWVCLKADGKSTQETCADALHDAVAAGATFGSAGTDGWALLDGGNGDCDNQARCMKNAVEMLGCGPASVKCVRASTDAGAGNCLNLETHPSHANWYLIMDFNSNPSSRYWNLFEGCCEAAGHYYAITPKKKEDNDYEMLKAVSCQQVYCEISVGAGGGWTVTAEHPPAAPKP